MVSVTKTAQVELRGGLVECTGFKLHQPALDGCRCSISLAHAILGTYAAASLTAAASPASISRSRFRFATWMMFSGVMYPTPGPAHSSPLPA